MARKIRYSELETRTARERLKPGKKAHWRTLDTGKLALGYRRRRKAVPGEWLRRIYLGTDENGIGRYKQSSIGVADDFEDADGVNVFSFGQAQDRARDKKRPAGPLTVRQAIEEYVEYLRDAGKPTHDAEGKARVHILPTLGSELVDELTAERLRKWHAGIARAAPQVRRKAGKAARFKEVAFDDPEVKRRRQATANRVLTVLKAALNHAFDNERANSNAAWARKLKPFRGAGGVRLHYLSIAEAQRLLNACDPDFRLLVRAALETGARYSELTRLQVVDFNGDAGTVHIRRSKSGKERHVILTADGIEFFHSCTVGRSGDEIMFKNESRVSRSRERGDNADPGDWRTAEQARPMNEAVKRAKIKPHISFHGLRHTWASISVMNGMPLLVVARNLGHKDTRMVETHYGHLAPSFVVDAVRAGAPRWGTADLKSNVKPLKRVVKKSRG
jgi:integrase